MVRPAAVGHISIMGFQKKVIAVTPLLVAAG